MKVVVTVTHEEVYEFDVDADEADRLKYEDGYAEEFAQTVMSDEEPDIDTVTHIWVTGGEDGKTLFEQNPR